MASDSNGPDSYENAGSGNKFDALDKIKAPNLSALMCSRPNNIVSGTIAGVGNTLGGVVAAVGRPLFIDDMSILCSEVSSDLQISTFRCLSYIPFHHSEIQCMIIFLSLQLS